MLYILHCTSSFLDPNRNENIPPFDAPGLVGAAALGRYSALDDFSFKPTKLNRLPRILGAAVGLKCDAGIFVNGLWYENVS